MEDPVHHPMALPLATVHHLLQPALGLLIGEDIFNGAINKCLYFEQLKLIRLSGTNCFILLYICGDLCYIVLTVSGTFNQFLVFPSFNIQNRCGALLARHHLSNLQQSIIAHNW